MIYRFVETINNRIFICTIISFSPLQTIYSHVFAQPKKDQKIKNLKNSSGKENSCLYGLYQQTRHCDTETTVWNLNIKLSHVE